MPSSKDISFFNIAFSLSTSIMFLSRERKRSRTGPENNFHNH
nr:MAG TPA: hypothetical protein [Caudoviricetes sp.]